ncbi:hypothetical protein B7P43_G12396 [Cryptotermes secundus]|uniref:EF-hand domain-containing protein n=1 Tax=Cryptotermes secundus TaxID=105785 RepID=A0A2J7PRQ4_9NEOP|nr:hypothetical protein B7P43_G12396 [Cryptotermes secundus]
MKTVHHVQVNHSAVRIRLDFLGILSKVSRGSVQEKLQWIFGLYDLNGDGLITKNEMLDVVTSIYEMLGRSTEPVVEEHSAKEHVEKIFHAFGDDAMSNSRKKEWYNRFKDGRTSVDSESRSGRPSTSRNDEQVRTLVMEDHRITVRELTNEIGQIDTNKDGVVTIDELVEWCSRDEQILQSLETLDTVL